MDTQEFGDLLYSFGFRDFVGVPCSFLAPLINYAINQDRFIMANNEGDAVAIASGISLSPQSYGVVLMQNSGLANAISPLTSLNHIFRIPILGFVSLRGERNKDNIYNDEPQHELMGMITHKMLENCAISYEILEDNIESAKRQIIKAKEFLDKGESYFFIVKKGVFSDINLVIKPCFYQTTPLKPLVCDQDIKQMEAKYTRLEVLQKIALKCQDMIILATTGKTGRELYENEDRDNQFYMVGSMGCVSSLGLGIALKNENKIVCIDGDGALLMRMGAMSTNAFYTKKQNKGNFCHILLDNQAHDSTGGQFTLSDSVNFLEIARACGYENVYSIYCLEQLEEILNNFKEQSKGGATFIYIKIKKGSKKDLGRPKITPHEVAKRLTGKLK